MAALGAATVALVATLAWADFPRPTGIFLLSDPGPPPADLLALPFVDGFAQRLKWWEIEPAAGDYRFDRVNEVVAALRPLGKPFTLSIVGVIVPPDLVASAGPETMSVIAGNGGNPVATVLPWHAPALARWTAFLDTLSSYRVPDDAQGGALVPLRDHSLLYGVALWPVGMNGIRDPVGLLRSHPLYERQALLGGVLYSIAEVKRTFPRPFAWLPFFRLTDGATPRSDEVLLDSLKARWFDGVGPQQLGLFVENLGCSAPSTTGAFALYQERENTYTAIQALQGWVQPFANPAATDPCLVTTVPGDRTTAISGPEVGMRYAYDTFHCRYFEMYKTDLGHQGFADEFSAFHTQLHGGPLGVPPATDLTVFRLFPNPAHGTVRMQYSVAAPGRCRVGVFDLAGRRLRTLLDGHRAAGQTETIWDGRDHWGREVRPGVYLVRVETTNAVSARLMIWR